jgi:hypothetical protein
MYIIIIVVAVVAVTLIFYSSMVKPSQEISKIIWRRSGGFAGLDDTLVIESDGSVMLSSRFLGEAEFTLSKSEWASVKALIEDSGFMELNAVYKAKPNVADYFSYALTVETDSTLKQVQWVDEWASENDLPVELVDIGDRILVIIHGTGTGAIKGVVSDDGGNPLPGLRILIIRGSVGFPEIAVTTGEDGSYNIGSVPPGVFTIGVHDESGERVGEDTVFVRGGETSRLDFVVSGKVVYDHSGGVSLFDEGIYVIATDVDPTDLEVVERFEIRNDYWRMLLESASLNPSSDDFISVLISRGDFPTGGYLIQVKSFDWLESYPVVFRFKVDFIDPGEGVPVTEAFTNPIALIPIDELYTGLYIVRVHIDSYIMTFDESGNPVYDQVETLVEEVWEIEFEVS